MATQQDYLLRPKGPAENEMTYFRRLARGAKSPEDVKRLHSELMTATHPALTKYPTLKERVGALNIPAGGIHLLGVGPSMAGMTIN
jgi:hypothetical protein